jgi:hypothetical protein
LTVSTESAIDPYGGYRECWTVALLNAASQGAGLVFDTPAVRPMPATNQIAIPDKAHFESCGPTALAAAAYGCGHIADSEIVPSAVDGCQWLGDASVASGGTGTAQLLIYARHRGWPVHEDDRKAGDLALALAQSGHIGLSALNTAYGTGCSWNILHPQQGGGIGHWEGFGAVDGPVVEVYDMNAAREDEWNTWGTWLTFAEVLRRVGDKDGFAWMLSEIRSHGPATTLWKVLAGPEASSATLGGGEAAELVRLRAELDALKAEIATDEQAARATAAGADAVSVHLDLVASAVTAFQSHIAQTTTVTTSSTTPTPAKPLGAP